MSNPSNSSGSMESVPPGHVRLILAHEAQFFLDIPSNTIRSLCLKPRKYLGFLGWCILGVDGSLSEGPGNAALSLDGDLDDQGIYHYITEGGHTGRFTSTF